MTLLSQTRNGEAKHFFKIIFSAIENTQWIKAYLVSTLTFQFCIRIIIEYFFCDLCRAQVRSNNKQHVPVKAGRQRLKAHQCRYRKKWQCQHRYYYQQVSPGKCPRRFASKHRQTGAHYKYDQRSRYYRLHEPAGLKDMFISMQHF